MKKSITILILISVLLSVVGCSSNDNNVERSQTQDTDSVVEQKIEKKEDIQDVEILESGYSMTDDNFMRFGFVIVNPNEDIAFEFPTITVTAYDDSGSVLATTDQVMNSIEPGERQAFGSVMDCNGQMPSNVEFSVESGDKKEPSNTAIKSSDLIISGTNERMGDYGDISITGSIKNNSSEDTTSVGITVLFKNGGEIVYGTTSYVHDLSSGSEKPFEISEYNVPEHDSFEVTAHDWGY